MTLGQLKKSIQPYSGGAFDEIAEYFIEKTHQATVEEIIKIAEGMQKGEQMFDNNQVKLNRAYNQALTDLIKAIKK